MDRGISVHSFEFLDVLFLRYFCGQCENFRISVSMGVSCSQEAGNDYTALFNMADHALYAVKRAGRGQYRFYNTRMDKVLSAITPIDGEEKVPAGLAGGEGGSRK